MLYQQIKSKSDLSPLLALRLGILNYDALYALPGEINDQKTFEGVISEPPNTTCYCK